MQMVVLAGPARVGKTTIAKYLAELAFNAGLRPHLLSFAGVIKDIALKKGLTKEKDSVEYRAFCQKLGSSKRAEDPEYWIKQFHKQVEIIKEEELERMKTQSKYWEDLIIVDDCRYMNEVGYGMEQDAVLVFVSPGKRLLEGATAEWRTHESEALSNKILSKDKDYQDIFPWIIKNDKTLKILRDKLSSVYGLWCGIEPDSHFATCDCELCTARRQDRPPDIEQLLKEALDNMLEEWRYEDD
jgi:dephospho-CoA kinase